MKVNKIISKENFSANVVKFIVEAPLIAKARRAGHFVMVRVGEKGERIPLTIADADVERGTITLVIQRTGVSSTKICALEAGDYITDMVGPLGKATHIENFGTVVCACGGVRANLRGAGVPVGKGSLAACARSGAELGTASAARAP